MSAEADLDAQLVHFICSQLFPSYNINQELLLNWQVDLTDCVGDSSVLTAIIEEEVVVGSLSQESLTVTAENMIEYFHRFHNLNDEVFGDFKIIITELIAVIFTLDYSNKIYVVRSGIYKTFVENFLSIDMKLSDLSEKPLVLNQLMKLLVSVFELGCDTQTLQNIVYGMLKLGSVDKKLVVLEFLNKVFDAYSSHFKFYLFRDLGARSIPIPFENSHNTSLRTFLIQTWFKVTQYFDNEAYIPVIPLFKVSNSSNPDSSTLKVLLINYNQVTIEVRSGNERSKVQFSFNQILSPEINKNQGFTHLVLTFDKYSNFNLFIDGDYSESIPFPDASKIFDGWDKLYFREGSDTLDPSKDELILRNLSVLSTVMAPQWINLFYNLGLGYEWNFKEFSSESIYNILNHLSFKGLTNVSLKFKEITGNRNRRNSLRDSLTHFSILKPAATAVHKSDKHLANGLVMKNLIDKELIANSLISSKFKESDIVLNSYANELLDSLDSPEAFNNKVLVHQSESIHGAFYIIGGTPLILRFIEGIIKNSKINETDRDTLLMRALSLLLSILDNNWRLSKEFDNINGYGILSILLSNYKSSNRSLDFNLRPEINAIVDDNKRNLWNLILKYCGFDKYNKIDSIITNPNCYRFLVLNFDLFNEPQFFKNILNQFNTLMLDSKFSEFNCMELNKMKLSRKLLHFLKSSSLNHLGIENDISEEFCCTITTILKTDPSVENIRSISHFIVYSFYCNPQECNPDFGVLALKSFTNTVCDRDTSIKVLKKFSRSITIHWILLLLDIKTAKNSPKNSKDVIIHGTRLLSKLLSILGPKIIRKFFEVNRGLDILTQFLKSWWTNDEYLCHLYYAAFGLDIQDLDHPELFSLNQIIPLADDPKNQLFNKLVIPDFLNLLNNLVLSSVYTLSERKGKVLSAPNSPTSKDINLDTSLDAIHLISLYAQSIEKGHNNIKVLASYYSDKVWIDGIFELIGYLRLLLTWEDSELLQNFKNCYDRLTRIMTDIFIPKLFGSTSFFEIFNRSNDFTKKLILKIIFPKLFDHINEFINVSKFIFNEKEFMQHSIHLLLFYNEEYINQNFYLSEEDLNSYSLCVLSILEANQTVHNSSLRQLRACLGNLIILKLMKLSNVHDRKSNKGLNSPAQDIPTTKFNNTVKLILERQMTIFQHDVLNEEQTAIIIVLLLGSFFKVYNFEQIHTDHLFNLLRTVHMMRQDDFPKILEFAVKDVDYSASLRLVSEFFETLLTKNDEETLKMLSKVPTYKHTFNQKYYSILTTYNDLSKLHILDIINVTLSNGGKLGQLDSIYIKSFERDCLQLKNQLLTNELIKSNRTNQDHKEKVIYFAAGYNSLKIEIERLLHSDEGLKFDYTLDFIENSDRMRSRLVIEDQLSESEKLAYHINVPVKSVQAITSNTSERSLGMYNAAIDNSGISTLSLSTDEVYSDLADDSYELIDDVEEQDENEQDTSYEDKNRKVLRSLFLGDHIVSLWNISQINGLAPIESLMILGSTHLYIIENYFHQQDGNVIDVQDAPVELRDPYLQLVNSQSAYFRNNSSRSHRSKNWSLDTLSSISKRQFLLRDIAVEMFFTDGASILLTCISSKERDSIYNRLYHYCLGKGLDHDLSQTLQLSSSLAISNSNQGTSSFASKLAYAFSSGTPDTLLHATKKWKNGEMSNFYYLMIINTLSGRTFNDLTQYPVFPWVIADYTSETLDFSNPKTFRDLSKPMGAQTEARASQFRERFDALSSLEDPNSPAFHYGTHYSSAMIVTSFLIRLKPYVHSYLLLQGGKFDHADRLFNSIEKAWNSASKENTTDVRELIPEFFYLPEFLVNGNNFEFGVLQSGEIPNNVVLPKWAHNDPKIFIQKNREALESPYVSANLHSWIDLIFGYKQSGPDAQESLNVFHHLSYNGAINLDNINDEMERKAAIGMINNFGQTPNRIFSKPHPQKEVLNLPNYYFSSINEKKEPKMVFESKLRCAIKKIEISSKSGKWVGRPNCVCTEDDLLIRKAGDIEDATGSLMINSTMFLDLHSSPITYILQIGYKKFLTGSKDGLINIWKCSSDTKLNLQFLGILRAHTSAIKEIKFSKSYKVGVSSDTSGRVILWDFVRFKYIRELPVVDDVTINISNDTGNIALLSGSNVLQIYSLNGELILEKQLPEGDITCMRFSSINNSRVETGKQQINNCHIYWSEPLLAIAYGGEHKYLTINALKVGSNSWELEPAFKLDLKSQDGNITACEVIQKTKVDMEDKLSRGNFSIILGNSRGKVFQW